MRSIKPLKELNSHSVTYRLYYHHERFWFQFQPIPGANLPESMTAEDVKLAQNDLDQQGILVNYKEKGYAVELLDNEDVDACDALQLKITITQTKPCIIL
jgi:hypothetical protein